MKRGGSRAGVGRPTKFSADTSAVMVGYFRAQSELLGDGRATAVLPSFSGFARTIRVGKTTLQNWEARSPEFSNAAKECRRIQVEMREKAKALGIRFCGSEL
jgi:hypothetical protein